MSHHRKVVNLLPADTDDLSAMISDILADRVLVWWCAGPDLSAILVMAFVRLLFDNPEEVAGVVVDREQLEIRFIHATDKYVIVTEVEQGRVDRERGSA